MNVITRGVRNAFRNSIRTVSIVAILGLSIGLALAMLVARASVQEKIATVKSSIGNTVSVSPAGAQGFEGGGEPLTTDQMKKVSAVANVTDVTQMLTDRLTTSNTDLESAIDAGSLGRRSANNSGVDFQAPPAGGGGTTQDNGTSSGTDSSGQQITRTFTPPVQITGTNNLGSTATFNGTTVTYTSGAAFDASKDEDVAIVGKSIAEKNSLSVGSTFTAYGKTIKVVGIYDTGNTFTNNGVVMQLAALQRLSEQVGDVTSATVTVDSIDNIGTVVTAIKTALGDSADVVSNQESATQAVEPLESVKSISTFSLLGAVVAGAVIILLTMVMIVRERRREIGVFKAIGASNAKVMLQFISESVTLTLLGMVAGIIIGAAAAGPVTKVLVNNSTSTSTTQTMAPGRGGLRSLGGTTAASARSVQASVGWDIVAYGFGTALVIAVIGSALPAFFIAKVRPAEVMRAE